MQWNTGDTSPPYPNNLPRMTDLRSVTVDIKATLSSAIADLRTEVRAIAARMDNMETATAKQGREIRRIQATTSTHTATLRSMQKHIEDLDNRGRPHNVRIRGLPESIETVQLEPTVVAFFNNILGRPEDTPVAMERIHRALHPKPGPAAPLRDAICCLVDFKLKENIMRKAR